MNQLKELVSKGILFGTVVKSNIKLTNGEETVMFTIVPNGISFEEATVGINVGLKESNSVESVQNEIYALGNGKVELFATFPNVEVR